MNTALRAITIASLLATTACGDSLVGGEWLEELMGIEAFPAEAAWELRWYQGRHEPLLVECGLREPWTGIETLEEVYFGVAEVPPPDVGEVPEDSTLIEGDGFSYGVALLVLTELVPFEHADPERVDLEPDRGTWGVVEEYLVLVADGEPSALREELLVEPDEGIIEPGVQLVGFLPEVVLGTGSFAGAIYPLEREETEYLWGEGLPAVHLDYLWDPLWEVYEGVAMGGAVRQDCGEEG